MLTFLMSFMISVLGLPWLIRWLRHQQYTQPIRTDGPSSHQVKQKTPTFGGVIIVFAITIGAACTFDVEQYSIIAPGLLTLWVLAGVGGLDDYLKVIKGHSKGLSGRYKLIAQGAWALGIIAWLSHQGLVGWILPQNIVVLAPYWLWAVVVLGAIMGTSNAVNLTDGLDGLVSVPLILSFGLFAVVAYPTQPALTGLCLSVIGALLGFLWWNGKPASIFMGDVGSLALGGMLAVIALQLEQPWLLLCAGGLYVMEALSVILQVGSFKLTGRRVFKMAPIHHHFELMGWPETKVVMRFWIVSAGFTALAWIVW